MCIRDRPKTDKLLQFTLDDGFGVRTIISGLAKHYEPETLVGKQVIFVANLAPRKMRGIESQGMILSVMEADGSLSVLKMCIRDRNKIKESVKKDGVPTRSYDRSLKLKREGDEWRVFLDLANQVNSRMVKSVYVQNN